MQLEGQGPAKPREKFREVDKARDVDGGLSLHWPAGVPQEDAHHHVAR